VERTGVDTRVLSAIPMTTVCEPYVRRRAFVIWKRPGRDLRRRYRQSVFSRPTPAAALRAAEMGCNALMKGTQVDGVYTARSEEGPQGNASTSCHTWTCCP